MPTEKEILNALASVMDPELGKNIVELDMVRNIQITPKGKVSFTLNLTIPNCPLRSEMQDNARKALLALPGVSEVDVQFGEMTPEQVQAAIAKARQNLPKLTNLNKVDRVIAVLSGKGGVGKSSVTAMLAVALARAGKKVGILDADITGPSIPKLFGLASGGVRGSAQGMLPAVTCGGVKVISANLLLKEEDAAIVWRGPMISRAIEQFWNETLWGKLDFLLVDMPPGTSDAAISVMQSLPVNGVLLVTSPQELSALVVRKAVGMMQMLNVEALGVIENMSYFQCPSCGQRHEIFGPSHAAEITAAAHAPLLVQLPLRPEVTALGDEGRIEELQAPEFDPIVDLLT